ncbi:MAG: hypothetical protein ACI4EE_09585 [Lachnospiraceae bacterium]
MSDIFGKVCSIFLAVIILFGMPLVYMNERAKTAEQMTLLTEATHFVDSVCNTGLISGQMLRTFYASLARESAVYEVTFLHEQPEYVFDEAEERYVRCETYHDEEDIRNQVEQGENYYFCRGDFFLITIEKKAGFMLLPNMKDHTVSIRYGGTVKYEAY